MSFSNPQDGYNPSLMHIISTERRIANDCSPDPLQAVSENGYTSERLNWDIPMKNPIQAYDVKSLSFIKEYVYSRDMTMDNSNSIRQRAIRGVIVNYDTLYVRKYPFEAFTIHAKKEFVNEILKARAVTKKRPVTAENIKTGEIIQAESLSEMAVKLDTVPSSVSMYLLRQVAYHDWQIWYTELPKPIFREKIDKRNLPRPDRSKPCAIVNIETKERIDYPSVSAAAIVMGISPSALRHNMEMGYTVKKQYLVYFIVHGKLVNPKKLAPEDRRSKYSFLVVNNETGEETKYATAIEASEALKVERSTIGLCAKKGFNCKGHKVFLVLDGEILQPKDKIKKLDHQNGKAVIAYNDKEELEFLSQSACARAIKASKACVSKAVSCGGTVKGYKVRNK